MMSVEERAETTSRVAPLVALCEDDPDIRGLLAAFLVSQGLRVRVACDGAALGRLLSDEAVHLVILDWMLPGEDGLAICARLRASSGPPVLMLTARGEDADRIAGLNTGADDYVAKPFNPHVLLAHVRALLRRTRPPVEDADLLQVADLTIAKASRRVLRGSDEVRLTAAEFDLLLCFAAQPRRVLSREVLMDLTRGRRGGPLDRTIDVQISRLRRKLEHSGSEAAGLIRAVRNAGYILAAPMARG